MKSGQLYTPLPSIPNKQDTAMNAVISNNGKVMNLSCKSVYIDASVNFQFSSTVESQAAFKQLVSSGVKCYHAGANAPHGPYLAIYLSENNNLKFSIQ